MANCIILSGGTWSPDGWCTVKRSLGPYRVASSLEDHGYSSFILDYIENFSTDEIIKAIDKHINDDTIWFGFSSTFFWLRQKEYTNARTANDDLNEMYYDNYQEVSKVINFVKSKGLKILYGGAKAPYFSLNDVDSNIDYYITGNADNSIIDVTNYLAGKVDSIQHLNDRTVDSTKYPEPDVKNIPTRWWNHNIMKKEGLPLELSRGCIFKCKFCDFPLTGKKKGTYLRDPEQIKDEMIKTWEAHGTDSYFFTDDTFNDDNDKLEALHKVFTSLPFKPKFASYLRVDLINKYPHQADLLADMGLVGTFFGLETMQPDSAKAIGKGLHPNKVKDRLYWLREQWKNRVNIEAGFILGLPYDTLSYFNDLLMWTMEKDNPIQAISFYPLMLFYYKDHKELQRYSSEFALNPEIYGYTFDNSISSWQLKSQKLNYNMCLDISQKFNDLRKPMNQIAGFYTITSLNTGIDIHDIYTLTQKQIEMKYNIPELNSKRIEEYKGMVL
jgi:hypothetical protein